VHATTDRAAIRALAADCVVYMPRAIDLADVIALLESGTNLVTTCVELFDGGRPLGDERRARILDACARGGASLYATGSSPGFITDALPFALLSLQRRVDLIEIDEFADLSQRNSPHLLFEQMGFGKPVDSFDGSRSSSYLLGSFGPSLGVLAAAAGRPVDAWSCVGEVAVARRTTRLAAGELAAGTIAAQRTMIVGQHDGADVVRFMAGPCAWRRAARRRADVPDLARDARGAHARLHGEPAGQRDPLRVRGTARDPLHCGPAADHAGGSETMIDAMLRPDFEGDR